MCLLLIICSEQIVVDIAAVNGNIEVNTLSNNTVK